MAFWGHFTLLIGIISPQRYLVVGPNLALKRAAIGQTFPFTPLFRRSLQWSTSAFYQVRGEAIGSHRIPMGRWGIFFLGERLVFRVNVGKCIPCVDPGGFAFRKSCWLNIFIRYTQNSASICSMDIFSRGSFNGHLHLQILQASKKVHTGTVDGSEIPNNHLLANSRINYRPQLVQDFWTINSITLWYMP